MAFRPGSNDEFKKFRNRANVSDDDLEFSWQKTKDANDSMSEATKRGRIVNVGRKHYPAEWVGQAVQGIVYEIMDKSGKRFDQDSETRKVYESPEVLGRKIDALLVEAFRLSNYQKSAATVAPLRDHLDSMGGLIDDAEEIARQINYVGERDGWSVKPQVAAQQQADASKQRIIHLITDGRPSYRAFDKRHGQVRSFNSDELQSLSREDLNFVLECVNAVRKANGQQVKELPPEQTDSLGSGVSSVANTPTQKVFIPHPDDPSREPTQAEMLTLMKNRYEHFRALIYPAGGSQARGGVLARINQIIRGEV